MYRCSTGEETEVGVKALLDEKKKIMGFGHGVYKIQDPRSPVVKNWVEKLVDTDFSKILIDSLRLPILIKALPKLL